MAKYCGNCGAPLDDDARVCGQCGTPVAEYSGRTQEFKYVDPKKREKSKKRFKLIGIVVIILIIVIVAVNVISNFTGRKGFVRKVMNAYRDYDIETLISLSSDMYYYGYDDAAETYFESAVGYGLDSFEESVGHNYKFSYAIDEIYDLSERRQDEFFDTIEAAYPDFDISMIEQISIAEVSVTVEQDGKSIDRTVSITMSKEDNEWRILYIA